MRISGFSWRRSTFVPLERQPEVRQLDLDPFTHDLLQRDDSHRTAEERERAARQLRRQLLEEILPHSIRPARARRLADVHELVHGRARPVHALCLSGGGIRSAAFSLGVLQALSRKRWLSWFDYVSTVSGGGYIGSWLSAWIHHDGADDVWTGLSEKSADRLLEPEAAPIRHLRTYANYLSPRLGILSADTWTLAATYLRNLLLNWMVLVPLLTAVLLVPWMGVANVSAARWVFDPFAPLATGALFVIGVVAGTIAVAFTHRNRPDSSGRRDVNAIPRPHRGQGAFLRYCLTPLVISVAALSTALVWALRWELLPPAELQLYAIAAGVIVHAVGFAGGYASSRWTVGANRWRAVAQTLLELLVVLATGAGAGYIAYAAVSAPDALRDPRMYVWLAAPVFMLLVLAASFVFTGWVSRISDDAEREWSARFAGWVLIPVAAWIVLAGLALFGPRALFEIPYAKTGSALLALLTGGAVAGFGRSAATDAQKGVGGKQNGAAPAAGLARSLPMRTLLSAGALVFAALLVVGLTTLGLYLVRWVSCLDGLPCPAVQVMTPDPLDTALVVVALLSAGLAMARLIDTNRFSLHAMYRARLIRTFLGASRRGGERRPDPFTGFDEKDDVPMSALGTRKPVQKPLHVVNMALNLVGGTNLAWRNRKARSFTVTPLYAGSAGLGYRAVCPTDGTTHRVYGGEERGITLGTSMTISGAAASPNMGYHSSPLITFLMTFFNLRLGWWLGNPGPAGNDTFFRGQPTLAVRPIIDEMFGRTDDRNQYVYLSDGGHFENLGLYEMVLRRCGRILVVDASCDPDGEFGDLANAMRLVHVDLGIPIRFTQGFNIYARGKAPPNVQPHQVAYWAEGEIDYAAVDASARRKEQQQRGSGNGRIYYLKPTLYETEPRDIYSYARASSQFPHESTADQFFSETQLESYRALGDYIGMTYIEGMERKHTGPLNGRLP